MNLREYDVILGRPFLHYLGAKIEGDDCLVPSKRGWQALPRWASDPTGKVKLVRLSRSEMARELQSYKREEARALILIQSLQIFAFLDLPTPSKE